MSGLNIAALLGPAGTGIGAGLPGETGFGGDFAGLLSQGDVTLAPNLSGMGLELAESGFVLPGAASHVVDPAELLAAVDAAQVLPAALDSAASAEDPLLALVSDTELVEPALNPGSLGTVSAEDLDEQGETDEAIAWALAVGLPAAAASAPSAGAGDAIGDTLLDAKTAAPTTAAAATPAAAPGAGEGNALPAGLAASPIPEASETIDAALAALRRGGGSANANDGGQGASPAGPADAFAAPAVAAPPARFAAFADVATPRPVRIDAGDFTDSVGARLSWMAEQRVGRAEIRVSPPELGAIDIELHIDGKQVRAEFTSAHADVRQALEAGLPKLREMLASQGLNLTQAEVGGQGTSNQSSRGDGNAPGLRDADSRPEDGTAAVAPTRVLRADALLDEYA